MTDSSAERSPVPFDPTRRSRGQIALMYGLVAVVICGFASALST